MERNVIDLRINATTLSKNQYTYIFKTNGLKKKYSQIKL